MNNKDIGHTNLIMDIDTSDSPPSMKKPYTLPLKHYDWVQQEIESWKEQASSPGVFLHEPVLSSWS